MHGLAVRALVNAQAERWEGDMEAETLSKPPTYVVKSSWLHKQERELGFYSCGKELGGASRGIRKVLDLWEKQTWYDRRRAEIDAESSRNGGRIRRQDMWSRDYFAMPYLARATEEQFFNRVCDVFHNQVDLDREGRISMRPVLENEAWMFKRWGNILNEAELRDGFPDDLMAAANKPLSAYFADGEPTGVRLFRDAPHLTRRELVKFSRRDFIKDMHHHGRIRIAPASSYASGSLLNAQQDLEVQRHFMIPTAGLILKGFQHANIEGVTYDITQGDVEITEEVPDYFVYCLCREIDRRLPTDFGSDAALIIHDPKKFQRRFFDAMREKLSGWEFGNGEVTYYDPYTDYKRNRVLEMTKHLRFYYQKEFRLLARPKRAAARDLEPFFIEIGSLEDISTPYFL